MGSRRWQPSLRAARAPGLIFTSDLCHLTPPKVYNVIIVCASPTSLVASSTSDMKSTSCLMLLRASSTSINAEALRHLVLSRVCPCRRPLPAVRTRALHRSSRPSRCHRAPPTWSSQTRLHYHSRGPILCPRVRASFCDLSDPGSYAS